MIGRKLSLHILLQRNVNFGGCTSKYTSVTMIMHFFEMLEPPLVQHVKQQQSCKHENDIGAAVREEFTNGIII
jgi:hypothetical protein